MKLLTVAAACLLLVANVQAATVVVNFEDVALGTVEPISSNGFNFDGIGPAIVSGTPDWFGGGASGNLIEVETARAGTSAYTSLSFSQQGLVPFDLQSFWIQYGIDYLTDVTVTGTYANGGFIQQQFTRYLWSGGVITLGAGWTNLKSASISVLRTNLPNQDWATELYVDNITVSTVPIPAAVWLFGSGLGLLGWMKRRARVSALASSFAIRKATH